MRRWARVITLTYIFGLRKGKDPEMIIEYVLIKSENDFCKDIDQFKSLLQANSRITFEDNYCYLSGKRFNYSLTSNNVKWDKRKEVVFYFAVSTESNNEKDADLIEAFDAFIRRVNSECGNHFVINTIWDDASIYYAKKLYPMIAEVENLLRKIIYLFMINIAGSAWFESTVPGDVKKSISNALDKDKHSDPTSNADQLYHADFVQLGAFFFHSYPIKPVDSNAIRKIQDMVINHVDVDKLMETLDLYEHKSNWDRYFAEKIAVQNLSEKWDSLYYYRNKVAHTKRLNKKEYLEATRLIKELTVAFNECLTHVEEIHFTEAESVAAREIAEKTVVSYRDIYSDFIQKVIENMPSEDQIDQMSKILQVMSTKIKDIPEESIEKGKAFTQSQDLKRILEGYKE